MNRLLRFALVLFVAGCGGDAGAKKSTEVAPDKELSAKGAATGLDAPGPFDRKLSAMIFKNDPPRGKPHLEKLKEMAAKDPDGDVRAAAAEAVKAIEKAP